MNLTETEAKTKWCPFARQLGISGGGQAVTVNRDNHGYQSLCFCIASECMAWKWEIKDNELSQTQNEFQGNLIKPIPPEGEGWINHDKEKMVLSTYTTLWRREITTNLGHCGLMK